MRAKNLLKQMHLPFPITSKMLQKVINKRTPKSINIFLTFKNQNIVVIGHVIKPIKIPFALYIKPISVDNRKLHFEITTIKPSALKFLKTTFLNRSPFSYDSGVLTLDLNKINVIKKIPFGRVKKVKVKNQKLWCGIGL
jgi:hypothetical protein